MATFNEQSIWDRILPIIPYILTLGILLVLVGFPLLIIYRTWKAGKQTSTVTLFASLSLLLFVVIGLVYVLIGALVMPNAFARDGGIILTSMMISGGMLLGGIVIALSSAYLLYKKVRG